MLKIKLTLFKLKNFLIIIRSRLLKKKINKKYKYLKKNFEDFIESKSFTQKWFLNNIEIFSHYLPKDLIPRHNFMIPVQAAIGGKIIARETIKGFKKDVLTKIHGGGARDRKRKLLDKQKKGKARGKQFGKVEIPQEAFIGVLKINKEK